MFKNILVSTDFSEGAIHAAEIAAKLSVESGGAMTLVHASVPPVYPRPSGDAFAPSPSVLQDLEAASAASLQQQSASLSKSGARISTRTVVGDADAIVALAASGDFDLVVTATHGRRGVGRLLLGSFAEQLVRTCTVPVLTIRMP